MVWARELFGLEVVGVEEQKRERVREVRCRELGR